MRYIAFINSFGNGYVATYLTPGYDIRSMNKTPSAALMGTVVSSVIIRILAPGKRKKQQY